MTLTITHPQAIAEVEELKAQFGLSADEVVERLILEAGTWMPMELLAYLPSERLYPLVNGEPKDAQADL